MTFKEYKGLDMVKVAEEVLRDWKAADAFGQSLRLREGAPEFLFFEGPPSANGMPGIHHVMARSIKDAVCRYKTMTGYKVRRRAGWDTHGLPVELGVEKKLGITKEDIGRKVTVEEYNSACRSEVMKYTAEWRTLTERIGYWVDLDDPYITYDNRYIETLWYLLKDIYGKDLLYKGKTIQPYSPAAGTGLSTHELNQPGCYRDVKDTTCVAQFKVVGEEDLYFLAWTTTPWTLASNTALCVGPSIDYVKVRSANPYTGAPATYIVAQALVGTLFSDKVPFEVLPGSVKGKELVGMRYEQLIPWFKPDGDAFRVIAGDYVSTEEGTGIVHIAPTFGADDARVAKAAGIVPLHVIDRDGNPQAQVDLKGRFCRLEDLDPAYVSSSVSPEYAQWAGRYVKNAYDDSLPADAPTLDIDLCVMLKAEGKAFKIEKHTHSYPHCWRTDKPVLYYPLDSWFIRATAVREKMMELNEGIVWKPEATGTGRFGKWLENIQDWNLSRSRYWGTPLPIWRTEDGREEVCIGSAAELYAELDKAVAAGFMASNPLKDKGFDPADMSKDNYDRIDLHRPYVDDMILVSPSGRPMRRETDLIDVWFDSGAMPYAQTGLRGKDTPDFGTTADFRAEGVDQTRGWFYTLHAIHTMVSGTPAFKRVISNGLVLDKKGEKMSKRLGNAVDPFKAMDTYGPDALRWYMMTNAQPWDNLKFDEEGVDEVRRKFFGTLYNTYSFFALYANVDSWTPTNSHSGQGEAATRNLTETDRWILSKLNSLIRDVRAAYEDYDITLAGRLIQEFVCDHLSNWYVRLGRKRFWGGGLTPDKQAAYSTLYKALMDVSVLAAPIAPFFMDRLWHDLTADSQSVHLHQMPEVDESMIDQDLEERMALAQQATSMVLALRRKVSIKVRQPLSKLVIPVLSDKVRGQLELVKDLLLTEVNVKEAEFISDTTGIITKKIKPNFRTLGKRYGSSMKQIAAALASMDQQTISAIQAAGTWSFDLDSGSSAGMTDGSHSGQGETATRNLITITPEDYEIISEDMPGWLVASEGAMTLALDVTLTPELVAEGIARELVNRIQNIRKDSGFDVTDKVNVIIFADAGVIGQLDASLLTHKSYLASQTLALDVVLRPIEEASDSAKDVEWEDGRVSIQVTRN